MNKNNLYLLTTLGLIFLIVLMFCLAGCALHTDPGQGKKIGRIVKFSKQGMLFKTWEGELIRGGFTDGSGIMGTSFHFTIENYDLAKKALEAFENQSEVIIDYRREFIHLLTRAESGNAYFVENITVIE